MDPILDSLIDNLKEVSKSVRDMQKFRATIEAGEEYQKLLSEKEEIEDKMNSMLPDMSLFLQEEEKRKNELKKYMLKNRIYSNDRLAVKSRRSKEVKCYDVLGALGGDIDTFMLMASITQKKLKEFYTDNPVYKDQLKHCIVEGEPVITDVSIY